MFKKLEIVKIDKPRRVKLIFKKIKEFSSNPIEKNDIYNLYRVCGHKVRVYHKDQSYVEIIDDEKWVTIKHKDLNTTYKINKFGGVKGPNSYIMWMKDTYDYCLASIMVENKQKLIRAHRLVAKAFIPNPKNKPQVNHIDSNIQNNYVYNLAWVTGSENLKHHYKKFGKNCGKRLKDEEILQIRQMWNSEMKYTYKILGKLFGVHQRTINKIVNNHIKPELKP